MAHRLLNPRLVRIAVLSIFASGCIIPFATPPLKGEIGGGTRVAREDRNSNSLHVAGGMHLASGLAKVKTPIDVGVGYAFDKTRDSHSHGLYVDTSVFIDRSSSSRTSVGARGELRWLEAGRGAAAKLRIDTEFFKAGMGDFSGDDKCGAAAGTYFGSHAVGLFVEAGHVWEPEVMSGGGGDAWVATAGVTVRLPSAVGVYVGIPGCK